MKNRFGKYQTQTRRALFRFVPLPFFFLLLFQHSATAQTVASVTVAAQTGALTYGTSGSATYQVTIAKSGGGNLTVNSISVTGLPAGVTASYPALNYTVGNAGYTFTLTLNITATASSTGSPYNFTVAANNSTNTGTGTLTIQKKNLTVTGVTGNNKVYDQTTAATINTGAATLSGVINSDIVTLNTGSATAVFSDKNVGTNKTINISGLTISGAGSANYNLVQPTTTGSITAAPLAISFTANTKTYDGLTTATIATRSIVSGLFSGDLVTISGGTASFPDASVANGKTVTGSGFIAGNTDGGNYIITPATVTTTANIAPAALNIKANDQSKLYGNTLSGGPGSLLFTPTGLQNGETVGSVTLSVGTGSAATDNAGTYTGQIIASAATGGTFNPSNYIITYTTGNIVVTQAPLTVTATAQTKIFGVVLTTTGVLNSTFTVSGLKNADAVNTANLLFSGTPSGDLAGAAVNSYTITPSALNFTSGIAGNYTITYITASLTVSPAPLTIAANDVSKVYGNTLTNGAGSTAFTFAGLVNGNTLTSVSITYGTGAAAAAAVATYPNTVTPSAAVGANGFLATNYTITYVPGNITVTPAPLTITANNQNKVYGILFTGGAGSTQFTNSATKNGETIGSVTITPGTGSALTDAVGTYTGQLVPSAATGGTFNPANYTITYFAGNLTVTPAALNITASVVNKVFGTILTSGSVVTGFAVTGLLNGNTISSVTMTYGAAAAANTNVGTYTLQATPSAAVGANGFIATNYTITYTSGNIVVTTAPLTITANDVSKIYGNTLTNGAGSTAFTFVGLVSNNTLTSVSIAYGTGAAANVAVGTYPNTVTPSAAVGSNGFLATNYTITYVPGNITVTPAPLTITANNQNKVYGILFTGGAGSTQFTNSATKNGETIGSVTITPGAGSALTDAVGTYTSQLVPSAATGGTFNPANYTITYLAGNLTVTPAALNITSGAVNKVFGTLLTSGSVVTGFTVTGLLNGNAISSVTMTYGAAAAANTNVGTYTSQATPSAAIGAGGFVASNYTISYTSGNIVVTTAPLTITANDVSKIYGNTLTNGAGSTAFSFVGLVSNNTLTSVSIAYGTGAAANVAVGTYPNTVTPSAAVGANGFLATNYTITYVPGNITVTPASLTITANNQNKVYGILFTGGAGSTQFTSSGLRGTETIGSVTITPGTGSALTDAVGTYTGQLVPSAATGGTFNPANYTITYVAGNLTVTPATLNITASVVNKVFGTLLTSGSVASGFSVTGLLNGNSISSVTMTYGAAAAANTNVGTYTSQATPSAVIGAGGFVATNYTITYTSGNIVVTAAPLTITVNDVNKVYGTAITGAAGSTAFGPTGLVNGNTITSVTIAYGTGSAAAAAVGLYTGSVTASAPIGANGFLATNYTINYVPGNITVTPATLTVTASNQTKAYGVIASTTGVLNTTFTATGLKNTDAISANGATLGFGGTPAGNLANAALGTYSITPSAVVFSTGSASNYTIVYVNGTLTVNKANTTISVTSSGTTCFGNNVTLTATVTSALANASGTVQFFYGATSLGSATLSSGTAVLNTTALPAATNSITATYSGDVNYNTSTSGAISLVINPLPTITTGGTINSVCFNAGAQTATLPYNATTFVPTSYSITWSSAAITAGLVNQVNTATTFTTGIGNITTIAVPAGVAPGTYTGTLTVRNNNGCISNNQAITLNIVAPPTPSNAGTSQLDGATCGITTIALGANTPTTGAGLWTITSGTGGSLGTVSSPVSNFSGVAGTTYTLTWTISNAPCPASASQVQIRFNPLPQGSFTANGPFCETDGGNGRLTFTATAGTGPFDITYTDGSTQYNASGVTSGVAFALPVNPLTSSTTFTLVSVQDQNCTRISGFTTAAATVVISTPPAQLPVTAASISIDVSTGTNIIISNSEAGVLYQLRNNATNANVGTAVAGNGGSINLPTGILLTTTTFNVLATRGACTQPMLNTIEIGVGLGIYWIAANNGYYIPTDGSTPPNQMQYRKVSTLVTNPADGRGQYAATINVQPTGGDAVNQILSGGTGDGFLFSSGTAAQINGTNNNWGTTNLTTFAINAVTPVQSALYGPVNEVGLNMSQPGYYTFVMRDSGRNKNSDVYIGYTTNSPISFTHNTASQRLILSDLSAVLIASLGAAPSSQEKLYVRYKVGSNDFSTGASFITPSARISNDSAIVILPPQVAGATVYYYFFTSTLSQTELQAFPETYKSIACLRFLDNSGTNYNYTLPAPTALYTHNFNTAPTAATNYTVTPNVFNTNFVTGTSVFTSPVFFATAPAQVQATSSLSPNVNIPTNGSATVSLTFDVKPGFYVSFSSLTLWASSSVNNVRFSNITINGTSVGTNIGIARNAGTGAATNLTVPTANLKNISGTITIVLTINNTNAATANAFIDNFSINGYVGTIPDFLGYTWVGTTNSNWTTPTNWAPNGIPGANDNATINTLPAVNITGAQSVKTLTLSGTGFLQIASTGSLTVTNNLIYENTAGYSFNCGSTINYTNPSLITIPALQYGNLNVSGGPRQLASGETTKICGNYTPTLSDQIVLESIVEFNGTTSQAILSNPASFLHLLISNQTGTVTANSSLAIMDNGDLTVAALANLNVSNNLVSLGTGASASISGTFTTAANLVNFTDANVTITGTGTLNYNATRSGMPDLGNIPYVTWQPGSTLSITGLTNPATDAVFASGLDQQFSNFNWNTPSLTTATGLTAATSFGIEGTFSVVNTGFGSLKLATQNDLTINCGNFSMTDGGLSLSSGTYVGKILVSGSYTHNGGIIGYNGITAPSSFDFVGTTPQSLTGTGSGNSFADMNMQNSAGYIVSGKIPMQGNLNFYDGDFSGTGYIDYRNYGGLYYFQAGTKTTSAVEWPSASAPYDVKVSNGLDLSLHANCYANLLKLNDGRLLLGNYHLFLAELPGVVGEQPLSTTNMVVNNGSGKLGIKVPTTGFPASLSYPVGENQLNPVTYTFTANNTARYLLVSAKETTHPNAAASDYLANRYWSTDLDNNNGTYTYSVSYPFKNGDLVGNAALVFLNKWNGILWSSISGSSYSAPVLNSGTVTESTASLANGDWTGRFGIPLNTYFWKFPANGSWTNTNNWTPAGIPTNGDAVIFSGSTATTVTNVPTGIALKLMSISGGGTVTMQAATAGTLSITGPTAPQFSLDAASSLVIGGTTAMTLNVGAGSVGSVSGKIRLRDGAHSISATDSAGLTFRSGSYFAAGVLNTTNYSGYPFGATGTNSAVIFKSGSLMEQFDGLDPFGQTTAINKVVFETGTTYRYQFNNTTATKLPFLAGRTYDNYEYNSTQNLSVTGTKGFTIRNLSINSGTLNVNLTASSNNLKGNLVISSGSTLNFNPASFDTLRFNGISPQTISGAGTLGFGAYGNARIDAGANVTLQKSFTTASRFEIFGNFDAGNNVISGTGRVMVQDGGYANSGHPTGMAYTGALGCFQTSFRDYSSSASYGFSNANGVTGDVLDFTFPIQRSFDSLVINSTGTITRTGSGSTYNTRKLTLVSGTFSLGSTVKIIIAPNGGVDGLGGRFAAGFAGGICQFPGTTYPGTPVTGDPMFSSVWVYGPVDFKNNATVTGFLQMYTGASFANGPKYATGSRLIYASGGTFDRGNEWDGTTSGSAGYPWHVTVQSGTSVNAGTTTPTALGLSGDLTIGPIANNGSLSMNALSIPINVGGSLILGNTFNNSNCRLTLSTVAGGDVRIAKSLLRSGVASNDITSNAGAVVFTGTGNDSISYMVSSAPYVPGTQSLTKVSMQKTAGDITLKTTALTVTGALDLQGGVINTSATNTLTIANTGTVTGTPSNASYVNGSLIRATNLANTEYLFPVGSTSVSGSNKYRPIIVSPVAATATNYTAQYLPATPTPNYTNQTGTKLLAIDNTGTWQVARSVNTNARVALGYRNPGTNWVDKTGATPTLYPTNYVAAVQYNNPAANSWALTADTTSSTAFTLERIISDENFVYSAGNLNTSAGLFSVGLLYPPSPKITAINPAAAYTGSTVTISGSNFALLSSFTIGGVAPASYTVDNANQITAVVGTGATGSVIVTNPFGTGTIAGFTYLGYISNGAGNWSNASTWLGAGVPPDASSTDVTLAHDVTGTPTVSVAKLTVNPGVSLTIPAGSTLTVNKASTNSGTINVNGTLAATGITYTNSGIIQGNSGAAGTIQLNQGSSFNGNNITYSANLANLVFNNSSGVYSVPVTAAYWPVTNGPANVTVLGTGGVQMQTGISRSISKLLLHGGLDIQSAGLLTVTDTLQVNSSTGIITSNAPVYGTTATLVYNTGGTFSRRLEWSGTSGNPGFPNDVIIRNNTTVVAGGNAGALAATALQTGRDLTISSGSALQMNGVNMAVPLQVSRNITINGTLTGSGSNGGDIYLGGNWVRNSGGVYTHNNRLVRFEGSSDATITGSGGEIFGALSISKLAGTNTVTLNNAVEVQAGLNLSMGIINTSAANMLTVSGTSATAITGGSSNSFVNGPLRRFTALVPGDYAFPVGKASSTGYKPLTLSTLNNLAAGDHFTGEYFYAPPPGTGSDTYLTTLAGILKDEYWQLDRTAGLATGIITLPYTSPGSGIWRSATGADIAPCADCNVAVVKRSSTSGAGSWNFTDDPYNLSDATSIPEFRLNTSDGAITSREVTSFSPFTIGFYVSVTLPVKLVSFTGRLSGADGLLGWEIANQEDLSSFELQYSTDGRTFTRLATITNNGKPAYQFLHRQLASGPNFYRLKVIEKTGATFISNVVVLSTGRLQTQIVGLQNTMVRSEINPLIISASNQHASAQLVDASGKMLSQYETSLQTGSNQWTIRPPFMSQGLYFLHIKTADGIEKTLRLIKE